MLFPSRHRAPLVPLRRGVTLFVLLVAALCGACGVTVVNEPFADGASQGERISKIFNGSQDTTLTLENGASLELPEGAVSSTTEVGLERMADTRAAKLLMQAKPTLRPLSAPHVLTPHGLQFERAVQLTLPITLRRSSGSRPKVVWLGDESDLEWKQLDDAEIDGDVVSVSLDHFSIVMLAEVEPGAEPGYLTDAAALDAGIELDVGVPGDATIVDASDPNIRLDAGMPPPGTLEGTLIKVLGATATDFVATPHTIRLVGADGDAPLEPDVSTVTNSAGRFSLLLPDQREYWLHVIGSGSPTQPDSTYDSLTLWAPQSGDTLVRVGQVGTASVSEVTANFMARSDMVSVQGAVYRVDATGRRIGTVGCATLFLDDLPSPATSADQRYVLGVLPGTLEQKQRTERSGKWFFGNVAPGRHTFRVSADGGKTFLAEKTVYLPFARKDALGEFKSMMAIMGIDVAGPDPTPANCPPDQ